MITGTSERSRIRSSVCQPSSSGIETSSRTRSAGDWWNTRRPARPSGAWSTSSITRTRGTFIPLSYSAGAAFATRAAEARAMARILIHEPHPDVRVLLAAVVRRAGHDPVGQGELTNDDAPELMILEPASAD